MKYLSLCSCAILSFGN